MLRRFKREGSTDFLRRGFEEVGIESDEKEIEEAFERLEGIAGWLTMYGYLRGVRKLSHIHAMDELFNMAEKLIQENLSFLIQNSRRYRVILKAVAMGNVRWSTIKDYVEFKMGPVNDAKFSIPLVSDDLDKLSIGKAKCYIVLVQVHANKGFRLANFNLFRENNVYEDSFWSSH